MSAFGRSPRGRRSSRRTRFRSRFGLAGALAATLTVPWLGWAESLDVTEAELAPLRWRLIGPAHMSGRVTDIAVPRKESYTVYCATATGGVWKTINNGTTWLPIFDEQGSSSIGAVAVSDSDPNVVWVGTGEANASSYSSWGDGVYKSGDGGSTWKRMGLADTHHIGRIVIDPVDPDIVYVAALGHLWGPNAERGLYKTTDGGESWHKAMFIGEDVGFVDVAMDPADRNTLYAAAYARRSDRFDDFDSVGIYVLDGGGLYKTTDGGETWSPLRAGLPSERVGRIGIAIAPANPDIVYAIVEVAPRWIHPPEASVDRLRELLRQNERPDQSELARIELMMGAAPQGDLSGSIVAGLSRRQQAQMRVLLDLDELDTGGGLFRSDDKGESWRRVNKLNEREGYYSQIRVDPADADHVYVLWVRTWESTDGGRRLQQKGWAFSSWLTSDFIHGDFHAMWIDPENSDHLIVGSDGGLFTSYDGGDHWENHPMPVGQFVGIAVDMQQPYWVYGGLQDNGSWGGPSATRHRSGIADRDWFKLGTADGGYVQVDPGDPATIYIESQYANIHRLDMKKGVRTSIRPRTGDEKLRFNFNTPFVMSPHDSSTLYLGAQMLLKTDDRGESWTAVSPDLSKGRPSRDTGEGATITAIAASPLGFAVLWAGTDDGNLHISRDGGSSWTNVAARIAGLPADTGGSPRAWVSSLEASHFDVATAYAAFDDHRNDDFGVYLFRTRDYGGTWEPIGGSLPAGVPVRVIREDRVNRDLLFVGTENGAFVSINAGEHWLALRNGLPTVPVRDMVIHPREADLVAGTHGRSIYIMDIAPLRALTREVLESPAHLFAVEPATLFDVDITRNKGASGARRFAAKNPYSELVSEIDRSELAPPGATIYYFLRETRAPPVTITIHDAEGRLVRELSGSSRAGLNRLVWDLRKPSRSPPPPWQRVGSNDSRRLTRGSQQGRPGPLVGLGEYEVTLRVDGQELSRPLRVQPDAR